MAGLYTRRNGRQRPRTTEATSTSTGRNLFSSNSLAPKNYGIFTDPVSLFMNAAWKSDANAEAVLTKGLERLEFTDDKLSLPEYVSELSKQGECEQSTRAIKVLDSILTKCDISELSKEFVSSTNDVLEKLVLSQAGEHIEGAAQKFSSRANANDQPSFDPVLR